MQQSILKYKNKVNMPNELQRIDSLFNAISICKTSLKAVGIPRKTTKEAIQMDLDCIRIKNSFKIL
jgi:hypothetical protein